MIYTKITNKNRAFTLIETLVAISILMIAIAGPLTVATKGYTASLDAKKQAVAINLAQLILETFNNMKDNRSWGLWVPDSNYLGTVQQQYTSCNSANPCTNWDVGEGYDGADTGYEVEYYFSLISTNQLLAVVEVSWQSGTEKNKVRLEQIFTNYER